jgi:hypothetical protein
MEIAYQERALYEQMVAALDRDDVPALKEVARKLCDLMLRRTK